MPRNEIAPGAPALDIILRADGTTIRPNQITSSAEAEAIQTELVQSIIEIEEQLEADGTGERPRDVSWRRRANAVLRRKKFHRQIVQRRIAELRKVERQIEQGEAENLVTAPKNARRRAFIAAAEELLEPKMLGEIWKRAKAMRPAAFAEVEL
ncbi:hypothetical protein Q8W71_17545 [Methylobacterium sp. NEAU 140]|uniref:hypothetical protein n=1 Tax=Methylobacterium sp. NEAU 140 TaxID=3064945 RepID=UPI0027373BC9|nr:hypothetical protein [Methylobacterium sp. NEAU 140]MDP4024432.1 hypothetical protein [Methylobacterium sp. NEAU 140]